MKILDIQENDDIVIRFKETTVLELYEYESDLDDYIEEQWIGGDEEEVIVLDITDHSYTVQFGDSSVAFIPKSFIDVVSINDELVEAK